MTGVLGCRLPVVGKAALAAAALAASAALPAIAAEVAQITLELSPPERVGEVVKVQALDRSLPQKIIDKEVRIRAVEGQPAEGAPGRWTIAGLEPGLYDLCVETRKGRFEGYALRPKEPSDQALTAEDREKVAEIFNGIKTYEDEKRILDLGGNGREALALVELIRRGQTSFKPGIVTWRVELWRFDKLYGVWRRGDPKVLRRFLVDSAREFAAWNWNFVPELGGLDIKPGEKREVKWTIPDKFDPAKGRAAEAAAPEPAKSPPQPPDRTRPQGGEAPLGTAGSRAPPAADSGGKRDQTMNGTTGPGPGKEAR